MYFFNEKGDMNELKDVLEEMKDSSLKGEEKQKYFVSKYNQLANKYPMIFKKASEPNFDYQKMFWMIDKQDNVNRKNISQHEASIEIGEELVNEHIKPVLNM